jgi:Ca2+-binding EF-hand superfamily protein
VQGRNSSKFRAYALAAASIAFAAPCASVPRAVAAPAEQAPAPHKPIGRAQFIADLESRFHAKDLNHDGVLDLDEIAAAQQKQVEEARAVELLKLGNMFAKLDSDHDGKLTRAEFMAALPAFHARQSPRQLIDALDGNGDGKISLSEYEAGPLLHFIRLDSNRDGTVAASEMESARPPQKRP